MILFVPQKPTNSINKRLLIMVAKVLFAFVWLVLIMYSNAVAAVECPKIYPYFEFEKWKKSLSKLSDEQILSNYCETGELYSQMDIDDKQRNACRYAISEYQRVHYRRAREKGVTSRLNRRMCSGSDSNTEPAVEKRASAIKQPDRVYLACEAPPLTARQISRVKSACKKARRSNSKAGPGMKFYCSMVDIPNSVNHEGLINLTYLMLKEKDKGGAYTRVGLQANYVIPTIEWINSHRDLYVDRSTRAEPTTNEELFRHVYNTAYSSSDWYSDIQQKGDEQYEFGTNFVNPGERSVLNRRNLVLSRPSVWGKMNMQCAVTEKNWAPPIQNRIRKLVDEAVKRKPLKKPRTDLAI
jgi:hypothetical protein